MTAKIRDLLPMEAIQEKDVPVALPSGKIVSIPELHLQLKKWQGRPIKDTYNGKAVIDYNGEPLFAELAVLRLYQAKGWDGVWVDCYRKKFRVGLPEKQNSIASLPSKIERILNSIKKQNNGLSGCWDLLLWKGDDILFVELKRSKKDQMRLTQKRWLESALSMGYENFLIVEWDLL